MRFPFAGPVIRWRVPPDTSLAEASSALSGTDRPLRADAQRNRDALIDAARHALTEDGPSASLEEISRRAGVGIGTLYRHFPSRSHLLQAVYLDEIGALAASASGLGDLDPWDALIAWVHRFVAYLATKRAVGDELFADVDPESDAFRSSREAMIAAGGVLLERAQAAGAAREDVDVVDVLRMVSGIAGHAVDEGQALRLVDVALDGLRKAG